MNSSTQSGAPNGYAYNEAGEVLADTRNRYIYDAEGRLCAVKNFNASMTGYIYDAHGGRVAKGSLTSWSCNVTTNGFSASSLYVLGLGGEQVSEVAVSGSASTWVHTNVFAGGKLLATYRDTDTYFALADWLGTKRAEITPDQKFSTFFSLPYGNGQSTSGNAADDTEHHFTGKERDTESGNDYFGARYYASTMGRFMSPDWSAKVEPVPYAKLDDPLSLNLYAYVRNNPLARFDADGHLYRATPALPLYALFDTFGPLTSLNWEFESAQAELTDQRQAQQQEQKAEVGYGETAGLVPERAVDANPKKKSPYDSSTWDPSSTQQLQDARQNIMDVSDRNSNVKKATASDNSIEQQAWNANMDAAKKSNGSLPGKYFYIRQEGANNPQRPSKKAGYGQGTPLKSYGPFRNVGGGDVPRGNRTFIDIYDK